MFKSVIVCVLVVFGLPLGQSLSCLSGNYSHDGKTCCLCPKGYFVYSHCDTANPQPKCDHCQTGSSYTAEANSQEKCEQCTVCNSKANLEEERHCTTTSDVICTCKKGYFCEGEHCKACHQCQECELGEEEPCTPRSNTVCKKHSGAKDTAGIAIGAAVAVVVVVALICGALWWKKKFCFAQRLAAADHPEKIPLKGIDLKQFIGDIVDLLSWSDMVKVADRTGMDNVQVVRHKHDNPTAEEQTRSLLIAWIELQGLDQASETLCQTLRKCNLNQKADKIERLISPKVDV
ncbi:tumor necrosis factor receptor superfamily member 6 isoform X2 [Alosa sapidissima]|uniref:tumor necrosis factor receptor superfamily member 6 isoform X2 n=1 Tax=Alosa sapidissima TaxID=34773 RepID=UPI001C0A0406|nr:tumor necrosis factor receptor superfamily member 6 isoform X2 [Alosa sapidissima]